MHVLEEIYRQRAKSSFVFNNFYDESIMDGHDDIKDNARQIVDMIYEMHLQKSQQFDFYAYRFVKNGNTYDIYLNFSTCKAQTHNDRPLMFLIAT